MKSRGISLVLIAGIILVLNLLASQFFVRFDTTEDKQYTHSPATKSILKNNEDPVSVKTYFYEKLQTDFERLKREFRDMLIEYRNLSGRDLDYVFVDPNADPQLEQEALQSGIR